MLMGYIDSAADLAQVGQSVVQLIKSYRVLVKNDNVVQIFQRFLKKSVLSWNRSCAS